MFNEKIDIFYRLVCLFAFVVVIIFLDNLIGLCVLAIIFLLINKAKLNFVVITLLLLMLIGFLVAYYLEAFNFLRLLLMVCSVYYFIDLKDFSSVYEKTKVSNILDTIKKNNKQKILVKGENIDIKKIQESVDEKSDNDYSLIKENEVLHFANENSKEKKGFHSNTLGITYVIVHLIVLFISIVI